MTDMYINDIPVCVACDNEREKKGPLTSGLRKPAEKDQAPSGKIKKAQDCG
jgi:hypothetical protein